MADEAPKVQLADTLTAYEGREFKRTSILPTSLKDHVERGREYRAAREKSKDPKDLLAEIRKKPDVIVTQAQIRDMLSQFGAGMTKLNGEKVEIDPEKVKAAPDKEAIIRSSYEEGEKQIKGIQSYLKYSEVVQEAFRTGKGMYEMYQKMYPSGSSDDWRETRENALDALINTGIYERMAPDFKNMGKMDQREFIERFLASDPKLQQLVSKEMHRIEEEMSKLPQVVTNEKLTTAKAAKEQADIQKNERVDELLKLLNANDINIDKGSLMTHVDNGTVRADKLLESIKKGKIDSDPALQVISEYVRVKTAFDDYDKQMTDKADKDISATLKEKHAKAKEELDKLEAVLKDVDKDVLTERLNDIKKATDINSEAGTLLKAALTAGEAGRKATQDIGKLESTTKEADQQSIDRRLRKESEIQEQLEIVLYNAVIDTLTGRVDEVNEGKAAKQGEEKKVADEAKEKKQAEMHKKIKEAMEQRWIHYEKGKREKKVNKDNIAEDIKVITYEGTDGIRRLMLRDMGITNWDNVDLESLDDDTKRYLEHAFKEEGDKYRDTLLKDYFIAKGRRDNSPRGKLYLKDHEWELLDHHFGGKIDEALKSSDKAKAFLEDLEKRGIKPSRSLKWLLYVLLGGAAVAGLAATAPVVAPAVASMGVKGILGKAGEGTAHAASAVWNGRR